MLLGLLATRTVNLNKLACVVFGDALQSSRYRRIQRFFSKFLLDYQQIAGFIFKLFFVSGGQWYLSRDRTNWRWGKSDCLRSNNPRKTNQEMEPTVENKPYRAKQSTVA